MSIKFKKMRDVKFVYDYFVNQRVYLLSFLSVSGKNINTREYFLAS